MTRAEMRREQKKKAKTPTYNVTEEQLRIIAQNLIENEKEKIAEEATADAFALMIVIPMTVLMDYYWPKSYRKKIPEFVYHVLEYYSDWEDGKRDMDQMVQDLWDYAGLRIEREK